MWATDEPRHILVVAVLARQATPDEITDLEADVEGESQHRAQRSCAQAVGTHHPPSVETGPPHLEPESCH